METNRRNPYYIMAPPYTRTSAGVRVLYRLCDMLNRAGESAFVCLTPRIYPYEALSPMDIAPILTQKTIDYHFENDIPPIVVYPETFKSDQLVAPFKVEYFLNYPGEKFDGKPDLLLAYSSNIALRLSVIGSPLLKLNILVSDNNFFVPPEINRRQGSIFYAGKYKYHYHGKTAPLTDGMIEIGRDPKKSQSPEEIRRLFQESEYFYCFEDTALVLEALLCGCPVVLIPNHYFSESLAYKELKGFGIAWGDSQDQLEHARKTVHLVRGLYFDLSSSTIESLKLFIDESQRLSKNANYSTPFSFGVNIHLTYFQKLYGRLMLLGDSMSQLGAIKTLKIIFKRIMAGRWHVS